MDAEQFVRLRACDQRGERKRWSATVLETPKRRGSTHWWTAYGRRSAAAGRSRPGHEVHINRRGFGGHKETACFLLRVK